MVGVDSALTSEALPPSYERNEGNVSERQVNKARKRQKIDSVGSR